MEAAYDFEPIQLVVPVRKIKRIAYFDGLYVFKVRREDLRKQRSQLRQKVASWERDHSNLEE